MSSAMHLKPTKLGTKSYWDAQYTEEVSNYDELGDEGEIWFGQESVDKMVDWAVENVPPHASSASPPFILDVGTGNGILCLSLVEAGYDPHTIVGIDYSEGSVELSKRVAKGRNVDGLTFELVDFIHSRPTPLSTQLNGLWDLILDKGTFDAIALYGTQEANEQHPIDIYPERVEALLPTGGFFLITSCNFTEEEIKTHFTTKAPTLKYHSRIQHPTFTFAGKSGSLCCSVAFRKE